MIEHDWNEANQLPANFQQGCRDSEYLIEIAELKKQLCELVHAKIDHEEAYLLARSEWHQAIAERDSKASKIAILEVNAVKSDMRIEELKKQLENERKKNMWSIPAAQCEIIANCQTAIDALRKENDILEGRLKETEEKWHAIQGDRTRTLWKLNDTEFHNKRLSAEITSLKKQMANKTAKCERQAQELRKMNAKVNENCAGCRHKGAAADMLARYDEIKTLRNEIIARDEKIASLEKLLKTQGESLNKNDAATYQCMADVRRAVREWDRCVADTEKA